MPALAIHTPTSKARSQNYRSFAATVQPNGKGISIAEQCSISQAEFSQLTPGLDVIVLDREGQNRAEGKLNGLRGRGPAGNGVQMYDVEIAGLRIASYSPLPLTPNGTMFNRRGIRIL